MHDSGTDGALTGGGIGDGNRHKASGSQHDVGGDSLGLAALMRGGGAASGSPSGLSDAEAAMDALLQHLKVFLLFAVLLRHLQRFTVRTCHARGKVAPAHLGICMANNVLQTGAAEGLAFLSGVAMAARPAGKPITCHEVASPFVLILVFREIIHPAIEFCFSYRADIGTAHLWFVLMIGVGRLLCLPLSRLPRRARRARLGCVLAFLLWRITLAPTHIGWHAFPLIRRPLYLLLYGDRNYLQLLHSLPLFMLGFVHADARYVSRQLGRRALASLTARAARKSGTTSDSCTRLCHRLADCYSRCYSRCTRARALIGYILLVATFVADPMVCGLFIKKYKLLDTRPMLMYTRAALRVGALAMVLPRRVTPLTAAGRSQLLAYLLHDAVFSVGAQVVAPAFPLLSVHNLGVAIAGKMQKSGGGGGTLLTATLAAGELSAYAALCLAVQLALSHPRGCLLGWRRFFSCCSSKPRLLQALEGRARLAVRHMLHSGGLGGAKGKGVPGAESAV